MNNFGNTLKKERSDKELKLVDVSRQLSIDNAIISKIERGERIATRKQVQAFVDFYVMDPKAAFSLWLGDKILYALQDEDYGLEALKVAEKQVKYLRSQQKKEADELGEDLQSLLEELDALKKQWAKCKPLNKTQLEKMRSYFHVDYTFESNRIEGNTLTLQETHLVVNEGLTIGGKSMREHLEAINHYEAIDFIIDIAKRKASLNERVLKEIHYLILKGIDRTNAGAYRSVPVLISGSTHKPSQPYLIAREMETVFEFYAKNKKVLHPVILAAEMHKRVVGVHPFIDGNGRTSRLLMNLILLQNGFTIANLKGEMSAKLVYYSALEKAHVNGESGDFFRLVVNTAIESLRQHIELAGGG